MVLAVIVVGGPLTFIIVSLDQQNAVSSRSVAAREAQVGMALLTHDLREAQNIANAAGVDTTPVTIANSGSTLSFYLASVGSPTAAGSLVTWSCTVGADCTRQVGAATAVPEIRGVTAATFSGTSTTGTAVTSNPSFVSIALQVQVTSLADHTQTHVLSGTSNSIPLQDGVELRNYS
jgi:hypothetical protein